MSDFASVFSAKRQVPLSWAEEATVHSTWEALGLLIDSDFKAVKETLPASSIDDHLEEAKRFIDRGIGTFRGLLSAQRVQDAFDVVAKVEQAGWPRIFAFLDDRLWHLLGEPLLKSVMDALLGGRAQQLPGIWVHHVEKGGRGWEPHVDVSGAPTPVKEGVDRITLWLPLTSATCKNGCIFAVPGSHRLELMQQFDETEVVPLNDVISLFHKAEAMEAEPGDALLWRFQTLHWGGPAQDHTQQERLSLSLELGHSDVPAHLDVQPTWPMGALPSFETRLFLIGRSLLLYGRAPERAPLASRFLDVGRALVERYS